MAVKVTYEYDGQIAVFDADTIEPEPETAGRYFRVSKARGDNKGWDFVAFVRGNNVRSIEIVADEKDPARNEGATFSA